MKRSQISCKDEKLSAIEPSFPKQHTEESRLLAKHDSELGSENQSSDRILDIESDAQVSMIGPSKFKSKRLSDDLCLELEEESSKDDNRDI